MYTGHFNGHFLAVPGQPVAPFISAFTCYKIMNICWFSFAGWPSCWSLKALTPAGNLTC